RSATLIKAATLGLPWQGSASGNGDLFSFDDEIYRGSTATPLLGVAQAQCLAGAVSTVLRGGGKPLHRCHSASARACRRCDHLNASSASCRGPETGSCAS